MKKALPILFVASTVVVTAASLTVATSGGFTQLKAADNSYTLTFTKSDIVSTTTPSGYPNTAKFSFSTTTQSGFSFDVVDATVTGDKVQFNKSGSNNMVDVSAFDDDFNEASFDMTFNFKGVVSSVSATIKGYFEYKDGSWSETKTELSFAGSSAVDGESTIRAHKTEMNNYYITSIVVQYTCSY